MRKGDCRAGGSIYVWYVLIYGIPTFAKISEKNTKSKFCNPEGFGCLVFGFGVVFFFSVSMLALLEFPAPGC